MKNKMLVLSITAVLSIWALGTSNASATTWYVRDGGGNRSQCTGTTNAVYPGSGSNQPCAFSNPMYVLGAGCGNTGQNSCDVASLMNPGDTLNIVGDSDMTPGSQAQYPIGLDVNGIITPTNGNNCYAPVPENCTMAQLPDNTSIIGIGTHRPQLWAREHLAQVINDNQSSTGTVINNLEITQHSSCVYDGADPNHSTGGFPNVCHTSNDGFSSPYGDWGLAGVGLAGSNITLENNWIHGMGQWGVETGSLNNFTEMNNIISGNGGGGMGLGQFDSGGNISLGGTTTVSNEIIVYNGCGSVYPPHSSDPFDTQNYHNCADDSSSNGSMLADGWAIESSSATCNNVMMSNTIVAYNTKGGVDNLHCSGTGTFTAYRVRVEGNESQQMKLNYGNAYVENSQIINDCNYFAGQTFTTTCDAQGNCPPSLGYDFCRAAGNGMRIAVAPGGIYNVTNSTLYSNGGSNIELPAGDCNESSQVNLKNNLVINGPDYFNSFTSNTNFYENDTGSCNPIIEDYNLIYQPSSSQCFGAHDICNNPANAGVTGSFALNGNSGTSFNTTGLADQLYPSSSSPLVGAASTAITLSGSPNDHNNFSRGSSWDIGAYQHGSNIANGGVCFLNTECTSGICSNHICAVSGGSPIVTLTSPSSSGSVTTGSNVSLTATASEAGGSITKVSIFNGSTLLGSSSSSPYNFIMSNVAVGTYTLTASATDAKGVTVSSSAITINVVAASVLQSSPVVAITSPSTAVTLTAGTNLTINASASETNGSISSVSFYNGLAFLGSSSSAPFSLTMNNLAAGTYTLTAQATDAFGVSVTSTPVIVTVNPASVLPSLPVIALAIPGGNTYTTGSNITIAATASESNGTISSIAIYNGAGVLLGSSSSSPFNFVYSNVLAGSYTFTAKAIDANGVSVTSNSMSVTVSSPSKPVVAITSPSSGSSFPQGSSVTITASASETNGSIAQVSFYYNGSNLLGTSTSAPFSVVVGDVQAGNYTVTAVATDANGVSITSNPIAATVFVPSLPVVAITSPANGTSFISGSSYKLTASASETNGTIANVKFYYNGTNLLGTSTSVPYSYTGTAGGVGTYTMTAIATDANGVSVASNTISISITAPAPKPSLPVVAMTSPANGSSFTAGANVTVSASASETNGSIAKVSFYNGSTLLGSSTTSPYSMVLSNIQAGNYTLTAVALDAIGVTVTSSAVSVSVSAPAPKPSLPVVAMTSPANGSSFTAGANVTVSASASETNGSIVKVSFYNGSTLLGSSTTSPYSIVISNIQAGNYTLTAVALDAIGVSVTSGSVSVTVAAPAPVPSLPVVAMTSPGNGSSFAQGSNVTLTAAASETNGSITKVSFYYNGSNLLGTSTSAPFSIVVGDVQAGSYTLTAVATDAQGVTVTSAPITAIVTAPAPPSPPVVAITSPANKSTLKAGSNVTITMSASETNGSIANVSLYYNGMNLLSSMSSSPYTYTAYDVGAGTYTLTAIATDANGVTVTSKTITVTLK